MDPIIITVIAAVAALLIGLFIGKVLFNKNTQKLVEEATTTGRPNCKRCSKSGRNIERKENA
jgi:hypothetical protein